MDKDRAKQVLAGLAEGEAGRRAPRLRSLLPDVESALASGATLQQVYEGLAAVGLKFADLRSFKTTLWRLRKERDKTQQAGTVPVPVATTSTPARVPSAPAPDASPATQPVQINPTAANVGDDATGTEKPLFGEEAKARREAIAKRHEGSSNPFLKGKS